MKKVNLTNQHSMPFAIAFACLLLFVNYFFYQSHRNNYSYKQDVFCEFLLTSFSSSLEYGLNFGNKADLETTLSPLKDNSDIAFIKVVDNQGTVVAEVDNRSSMGISQDLHLKTVKQDVVQTINSIGLSIIPNPALVQDDAHKRRLGQVQIGITPYHLSDSHKTITYILLNLALVIPLALLTVCTSSSYLHPVHDYDDDGTLHLL